jgi:tetratricopeptide (TPR) repeat protein
MGPSCVNLYKIRNYPPAKMEVSGRYLIPVGGELDVDMNIELPQMHSNIHTGLVVRPVLATPDAEAQLEPMVIGGRFYERFNSRQEVLDPANSDGIDNRTRYTADGTRASYHATVDYAEWMSQAKLYADLYAGAYAESIFLGRFPVNGGVLDLMGLVELAPIEKYYYADPVETRVVVGGPADESENLALFTAGSSYVSRDEELRRAIGDHIAKLAQDPEVADYSVSVVASSSLEGLFATNEKLGQTRSESLGRLLAETGVPESKITFSVHDEGWDELLDMLPSMELSNTAQIERIIRTTDDLDQRESRIRHNYPSDYEKLAQAYSSLRYGRITITTEYKGRRGQTYLHTLGDLRSGRQELDSFEESDATPPDVYALHAQMLDAVKAGDAALASRLADGIPNLRLPEYIYYNKGMVMLRVGRKDEAKALLARARSIPEARYNLGLMKLADGDYRAAADDMAGFASLDSAVAMLYAGRNEQARDILLLSPPSARRDYLSAIACARLGMNEEALSLLSGAVSAEPSLRDKAAVEPDFNRMDDNAGLGTINSKLTY